MEIRVINLAGSPDRKEFQRAQAERIGLPIQFFDAVSRESISDLDYANLCETWERKMHRGEVCCFLSHKAIWKEIIEIDQPILILEDDAVLSNTLPQILPKLEELQGVDRVNLEARFKKKSVARKFKSLGSHHLYEIYVDRAGAAGYILWPSGAGKLLKRYARSAALADKAVRHYPLKSYQLEPAVVIPLSYCSRFEIDSGIAAQNTISGSTIKPGIESSHYSSVWKAAVCRFRRIGEQILTAKQKVSNLFSGETRPISVRKSDFES